MLGIEVINQKIIIVIMNKVKEFLTQNRTAVIVAVCSFTLGVIFFGVIAWFAVCSNSGTATNDAKAAASSEEAAGVDEKDADDASTGKTAAKKKDKDKNTDEIDETDEEDEEEEVEEFVPTTMVCVPFDEMHLRRNPGSDSNDNIATLVTGDKVLWSGESETANGND